MQPANKSRQYANTNNNANANNNNNGNGSNQNQIITSNDGIHTLHHHFFDCQSKPKATLLIVHGMSEHGGRYDAFAQFLAEQGIAVATYDQLGHGKTANCQEELGYVHKTYPVQMLLRDVVRMANLLKQRHPQTPHFIMGHSMGSFIVRQVLSQHSHDFTGAILMGTADKNPLIKSLVPLFAGLNRLSPKRPCHWAGNSMNKVLNSKLGNVQSASRFAWVSNNTDNINAYESDPLCGFNFTHNGFFALFKIMDLALNQDWHADIDRHFPLLLVSGKDDPVGNMGKGIDRLQQRLQDNGFWQINKRLYPNMRHEPLHEQQADMVFNDIAHWITHHALTNHHSFTNQ